MGYTNFENGKDGKTPINDTNLNNMQKELMKIIFPIGSTYPTQSNTNPSTILGFGTWERLKGRVCVGLDEDDEDGYFDEIGKTGGEKKHTLTVAEMPNHDHMTFMPDQNQSTEGDGFNNYYYGKGRNYPHTSSTGGGQAHNNMPPYRVVGYMWIRRA